MASFKEVNRMSFGMVKITLIKWGYIISKAYGIHGAVYWPPYHSLEYTFVKNRAIMLALFLPGLIFFSPIYAPIICGVWLFLDFVAIYGLYLSWGGSMETIRNQMKMNDDYFKYIKKDDSYREKCLPYIRHNKKRNRRVNNVFMVAEIILFVYSVLSIYLGTDVLLSFW